MIGGLRGLGNRHDSRDGCREAHEFDRAVQGLRIPLPSRQGSQCGFNLSLVQYVSHASIVAADAPTKQVVGVDTPCAAISGQNEGVNRLAALAMTAAAVESLRPTLVPRGTKHQAMVTGACVGTVALATVPVTGVRLPAWVLPVAAAVGAWRGAKHVQAQRESYPAWVPRPQNPVKATVAGFAAGVTIGHLPQWAAKGAGVTGRAIATRRGGSDLAWSAAVGLAAAAGLAAVGTAGASAALNKLREVGTRADPALQNPPDSPYVSGGPASAVDYSTLARDGRRFVSLRTPGREIASVDGRAEEPIRVYVGLYTAPTVEQRVDIAIAELERLGGFDRGTLLVMCPAGSGYADYVAAEAIECITAGDVASVVVQYGVLPSMLSLQHVGLGARTQRLLIDRIVERASGRVLVYGESLGARVAQEALQIEPPRVDAQGAVSGVDAVVSVGTPGGPSLRNEMLGNPNVVHLDRWQQMEGNEKAQLWFLDHDADPVTRWDGRLAYRYPYWLRRPRGRNVPADMSWLPVLTWWQVIFDLAFAAQQQSGEFHSVGHDYRADLAAVLSAVLGGYPNVEGLEALLAVREVARDEVVGSTLPAVSTS